MVDQLKLCDLEKNYVFCDDFHTKGSLASTIYPNHILYKLSNGHQMALFGKDIISKTINL